MTLRRYDCQNNISTRILQENIVDINIFNRQSIVSLRDEFVCAFLLFIFLKHILSAIIRRIQRVGVLAYFRYYPDESRIYNYYLKKHGIFRKGIKIKRIIWKDYIFLTLTL